MPLIFKDAARRSAKILGDKDRPVQIIFAGKAHPKDLGGQKFAQEIHRHAAQAEFKGRVVLLEDYDMNVALQPRRRLRRLASTTRCVLAGSQRAPAA